MSRRVIVASVGFTSARVLRGIFGVGFYKGDIVILVNSFPRKKEAEEAMTTLRNESEKLGLKPVELWLNPEYPFEYNVACIRALVEEYAPCNTVFLISGGLRWLAMVLIMVAVALKTIGGVLGDRTINVEKIRVELEEESEGGGEGRLETRFIDIPVIPKLADITAEDYDLLQLIGSREYVTTGHVVKLAESGAGWRIKELVESSKKPRTTISKKLQRLEKLGLVTREARGRGFIYRLTILGKILVLKHS
ncbi:CRISPR-associated CARF protein Csa3 [Desulfurococcus amylolyticus]|uniref:CRISPR locus-related DNA-binding protein n=1 Tax=Desulfurococcus amylolyticus DSM 16532 TaxID=768672 RepID=I3XQW4_DESAM|nr:CRISPR-associated CARF protein Csa3 [Desulfurococcus amylolyticus]AFL66338.1 CRISPR locus-related DNA-binding protein [Desulfurococcus amylolyticus DSM 16532]